MTNPNRPFPTGNEPICCRNSSLIPLAANSTSPFPSGFKTPSAA